METEQTYIISCKGGLDLTANSQELLQKPGWATRLVNFEPSLDGGYRRISGYTQAGVGRVPDATLSEVQAIKIIDNKFIIICHNDKVWITFDMLEFAQVNKDTPGVSTDYAGLLAAPELPRINSGHYDFSVFRQGTAITVAGCCGGHAPFVLTVDGDTLTGSTYSYEEVDLVGTPGGLDGASICERVVDQWVIAGMDTAPNSIYYSDISKPDDFEGANAGEIGFNDKVTGLKMFRETLFVFCQNSIYQVTGLNSGSPTNKPVTRQIGCVNGDSIQEIAGDLVFLAPDGLRTLAATDRIDDVNLNGLSGPIANRLRVINKDIDSFKIRTVILKNKLQYRAFFKPLPGEPVGEYSFIMYMGLGPQGMQPEFSQILGFDIEAIDNGLVEGKQRTLSGDSEGNLWWHDEGVDFNGDQITFLYQTPYFAINDPEMRNNIHKITTYLKVEGDTNYRMEVKYDYEDSYTYQPAPYTIGTLKAPAIYGETKYTVNNVEYGTTSSPVTETLTEGSGMTVSIRIYPSGQRCDPFSLQGYSLSYVPSGRI